MSDKVRNGRFLLSLFGFSDWNILRKKTIRPVKEHKCKWVREELKKWQSLLLSLKLIQFVFTYLSFHFYVSLPSPIAQVTSTAVKHRHYFIVISLKSINTNNLNDAKGNNIYLKCYTATVSSAEMRQLWVPRWLFGSWTNWMWKSIDSINTHY